MEIRYYYPGDSLEDAFEIRDLVFTQEQKFSAEIDKDEIDAVAIHVVFYDEDTPIATARTFQEKEGSDIWTVGRVCVRKEYRKDGIGRQLMTAIEKAAIEQGAKGFGLGAQEQASGFYQALGYCASGEPYYEEHCKHIHMEKEVSCTD